MKVFLVWSGDRSHEIARGLKDLLETCVQGPEYFISDDIEGGQLWRYVLANELDETDFGIICITPDNRMNRWLHFEAGALAKAVSEARVVPYLHGLDPTDVEQPLGAFQARRANEADTLRLAQQIAGSGGQAEDGVVERIFERLAWEEFATRLDDLPAAEDEDGGELRDDSSKIDEILQHVRGSSGGAGGGIDSRAIPVDIEKANEPVEVFAYLVPVSDVGEGEDEDVRRPDLPRASHGGTRSMMGYTDDDVIVLSSEPILGVTELDEEELYEACRDRGLSMQNIKSQIQANLQHWT